MNFAVYYPPVVCWMRKMTNSAGFTGAIPITATTMPVVLVRDTVRGKSITLRAGKSYTAKPKPR